MLHHDINNFFIIIRNEPGRQVTSLPEFYLDFPHVIVLIVIRIIFENCMFCSIAEPKNIFYFFVTVLIRYLRKLLTFLAHTNSFIPAHSHIQMTRCHLHIIIIINATGDFVIFLIFTVCLQYLFTQANFKVWCILCSG